MRRIKMNSFSTSFATGPKTGGFLRAFPAAYFLAAVIFMALFSPAAAGDGSAPVEIKVWSMGMESEYIKELTEGFEKENPGIRVVNQAIPWGDAHEKLITAIVGNVPPDLCQLGTTWMPEFQAMDAFEPLDEYIKGSRSLKMEDFFEGSLLSNRYGGSYYGVPWYVDTRVFYYRADVLAGFGYDKFPDNWDGFVKMLRELRAGYDKKGVKAYPAFLPSVDSFFFLTLLWQNGTDLLDASNRSCIVDNPAAVAAISEYASFFDERLGPFNDPLLGDKAFERGVCPMFVSGPWTMTDLEKYSPEINGKWSTAKMPRRLNSTSFIGGCNLVTFRDSKRKKEAFKLIEYLSRPGVQAEWYRIAKALPPNRLAWNYEVVLSNPKLKAFKEQLLEVKTPPAVGEWAQIDGVIGGALEEMFYKKITPSEAVAKIAKKTSEIMAERDYSQTAAFKFACAAAICLIVAAGLFSWFRFRAPEKDRISSRHYYSAAAMFLFPALAVMTVFLFIPIISSFVISFTNWNIYGVRDASKIIFIGFENYSKLLADPVFFKALRNTLVYALIGVPLNIGLALGAAILLNQGFIRFKSFFRLGFFLPVITTFVAVALIWRWLYDPGHGPVNWALGGAGFPPQNWLADEMTALPAIVLMGVWKGFGYNMMIFIAALQSISEEIYEAAEIDGASGFQQFVYITLPMIRKTSFFITVMTVTGCLHIFAEPYIMTGGGPMNSTMSLVLYMYNQGFKYYNLGYSSSIAYALFAIMAAITFFQLKISKRFE